MRWFLLAGGVLWFADAAGGVAAGYEVVAGAGVVLFVGGGDVAGGGAAGQVELLVLDIQDVFLLVSRLIACCFIGCVRAAAFVGGTVCTASGSGGFACFCGAGCGGRGDGVTQQRTPFGVMQSQQPCSHCGGRGTIIRNPCKTCRGTGKTAARKSLEINIPAGIDDDQNIALRGQGDAGSNGGPAGDVIVHVTVKADPMFERDGYDVTIHVPITFSQAVLGDDVEVPTVDGRIVQHIPEGTQSGTKFRLRGQGIQYLNGRGRGDQYVIVDVEIPKKVTRAQREALKAFEDSMKEDNYEKRKGFFKNLRDRFS